MSSLLYIFMHLHSVPMSSYSWFKIVCSVPLHAAGSTCSCIRTGGMLAIEGHGAATLPPVPSRCSISCPSLSSGVLFRTNHVRTLQHTIYAATETFCPRSLKIRRNSPSVTVWDFVVDWASLIKSIDDSSRPSRIEAIRDGFWPSQSSPRPS